MKKDEIMTWLIVAAGGLAVWWYLNNYGPNGAIATYGGTSYWTQWFGGTAAATTTTGTGTATPTSVDPNPGYDYWNPATGTWVATAGTGIAPTNLAPAGTAVTVPASTSTTSTATITEPMAPPSSPGATALITASSGQTALDADEWNFYWGQVTGVTQTANLYPPTDRTALMSAQDYINARTDAGLNTTPTNAAETGGRGLVRPCPPAYRPRKSSTLTRLDRWPGTSFKALTRPLYKACPGLCRLRPTARAWGRVWAWVWV